MLRRTFVLMLLAALLAGCGVKGRAGIAVDAPKGCHRIVVLSDAHYARGATPEAARQAARKLRAVRDVNGWKDVELVVVLGDIVARSGTREEYDEARDFIWAIRKPTAIVAGNHEYVYADPEDGNARFKRGSEQSQLEKLERFKRSFNQPDLYYTRTLGGYLLVFLSPDVVGGRYLTEISEEQLRWLEATLAQNRSTPTLIFFHAPLRGTLKTYNPVINGDQRVAQPDGKLRDLLAANPQVALWVSGHTHTPATNPSFASEVNVLGTVTDIHNSDMNRETIWTNSIYLCDGRIVVKTWDHKAGEWVEGLDRVIPVGRK